MKFEILATCLTITTQAEMDVNIQLFLSFGYCLFLTVLAIIFSAFPPKNINMLYGYRTTFSMLNQETWDAANSYWISFLMKMSIFNFIFPVVGYFAFPKYNVLITVIATTITLLVTIPFTEMFLKKNFDKNGNRI